jgi:hypothetical protein
LSPIGKEVGWAEEVVKTTWTSENPSVYWVSNADPLVVASCYTVFPPAFVYNEMLIYRFQSHHSISVVPHQTLFYIGFYVYGFPISTVLSQDPGQKRRIKVSQYWIFYIISFWVQECVPDTGFASIIRQKNKTFSVCSIIFPAGVVGFVL